MNNTQEIITYWIEKACQDIASAEFVKKMEEVVSAETTIS